MRRRQPGCELREVDVLERGPKSGEDGVDDAALQVGQLNVRDRSLEGGDLVVLPALGERLELRHPTPASRRRVKVCACL